jgi:hypothetical protein
MRRSTVLSPSKSKASIGLYKVNDEELTFSVVSLFLFVSLISDSPSTLKAQLIFPQILWNYSQSENIQCEILNKKYGIGI